MFRSGELLGIAPGGAYESLFGDSNYPVLWQSRVGFAKVALKADKPIIPVFTENIRENTVTLAGRMNIGKEMWEKLYRSTKMPVVPMYGLFPVKLRTHIGIPIYPRPGMTPEELSKETCEAVQQMIAEHQVLPGTITQALAADVTCAPVPVVVSLPWPNVTGVQQMTPTHVTVTRFDDHQVPGPDH